MTPHQVKAIQDSFAKVVPISQQAAALFYSRLFEIAPGVRPLFRSDMEEQGRKLMATLAFVVNGLGNLETSCQPRARWQSVTSTTASRRPTTHRSEALLWTQERGLGAQWTTELASAWGAAYSVLSEFMIGEAYGRSVAAE